MTIAKLSSIDTSRTRQVVPVRARSRGVPPALEPYLVFSSAVIREAERGVEELLGPHRLTVLGRDSAEFEASLHAARLREITFGYLDYRVEVAMVCHHGCSDYMVFMPTNGSGVFLIDGVAHETSTVKACIVKPDEKVEVRWGRDSPHLFIRISRSLLERQVTRMIGHSLHAPLAFDPTMNLLSESSSRFHGAIQLLHEEIYHKGSIDRLGSAMTSLEEFIASTLLLAQPSNYLEVLRFPERRPESRILRQAVKCMESHLGEEISIPEIVKYVGTSVRTLQKAFRQELGTTPLTFLRDLRLQRIHDELEDSDPSLQISISQVARRWGMTHQGRFAAAYRARYGETPTQTLQR